MSRPEREPDYDKQMRFYRSSIASDREEVLQQRIDLLKQEIRQQKLEALQRNRTISRLNERLEKYL